jgi:hypothetical protein
MCVNNSRSRPPPSFDSAPPPRPIRNPIRCRRLSPPLARHAVRPQFNLESISTAVAVLQRADHGTQAASIRSLLSESQYPNNPNYIVIRRACMSSSTVWSEPPTGYVA